jgi:deazaflavin-dependent oxidoreductase (nitroreductase family)
MPDDQRNEPFESPPFEEIPGITRRHVAHLETTTDESAWVRAGMRHLILRTVGRKSGNEHKVALPYWCDADGRRIVVASYAGGPRNPAWFHNLLDREANPNVWIKDRDEEAWVDAEILDGDDYRRVWDALVRDRAYYADYQAKCARRIPLIRLPARPR